MTRLGAMRGIGMQSAFSVSGRATGLGDPACRKCLSSKGPTDWRLDIACEGTAAKVHGALNYPGDFNLMRFSSRFALLAAATVLTPPLFAAPAAGPKSVPIPSLVKEVAVNMWYNVGSKDEPRGKTGFAHLFEHLMFNGSENLPGDYFNYLQQVGATDYNGSTSYDRTNYYETVPKGALA